MSNTGLLGLPAELVSTAGKAILAAGRVLVVSHIRPDGDAIGSLLGLSLSLRAAGKEVRMVLSDGVPSSFNHLLGVREIHRRPKGEYDLIIVVDCSDLSRTGAALEGMDTPDLNIDHHVTNTAFGRINLIEPRAVATAEILAVLLEALALPIQPPAASALLTGLITDTIGFRTSNMTPEALRLAASLVEKGADLPGLYQASLVNRSFSATRLWGAGLSRLERAGRLVWTDLPMQAREESGYHGKDDADLINILSAIEEADIALIFLEQGNGHIKVSWRAKPGFDISQLALSFGGGGHPAAAGADIPGTLADVRQMVIEATQQAWQKMMLEKDAVRNHTHKGMGKSNGKR